jgi:peptidoglycan/LPS O-acetylase OafA/YrhL
MRCSGPAVQYWSVDSRKTQARHSALDGLRGVAALSVLLFHLWLYARVSPGPGGAMNVADWAWSSARLGLVLFFVVSGFLLYRPWLEATLDGGPAPSLWRYLRSRAARILPAYYVALAGSMVLVLGLSSTPGVRLPSGDSLPLFLVFAQNLSPASLLTLDPPMWTLGVEVSFYLVLPLIGLAAMRFGGGRRLQAAVPLALIGAGLLWNATTAHTGPLSKVLPALLPFFAIGMLAALYRLDREIGRNEGRLLLLFAVATIAAEVATQIAIPQITGLTHGLLAACGFAALAILASSRWAPRVLSRPAVAGLGTISYGIYLWNLPLLWWLRGHDLLPLHPVLALPIVLALTLPVATASWFLIERPAIAWARRPHRAAIFSARWPRPSISS